MHTLTCITLECGDVALYLDGHYLGSEDGSSNRLSLADIADGLMHLPDVCMQALELPTPTQEDWCWNDIAEDIFRPATETGQVNSMTVQNLMTRLSRYPADALCCGTFWMADDFLSLDETLTEAEINSAMEIAEDSHDCNYGYNWEHLHSAISEVKG